MHNQINCRVSIKKPLFLFKQTSIPFLYLRCFRAKCSSLFSPFSLSRLFRLFTPFSLALLGLGLSLSLGSFSLSAATLADLEFTLLNDKTGYSVSAVNTATITGAVDIPATHNNLPVSEIGVDGFKNSSITSVTIPSSLKVIQQYAFASSDFLSTVTFAQGSQLTTIGQYTFDECDSIININLPDSLTTLGNGAFWYCTSLVSITIPSGVTVLPSNVFAHNVALETVTFAQGSKLTTIGARAFSAGDSLINIDLPDSLTTLDSYAFSGSSFTSLTFPKSLTTIEDNAFQYSYDLASITFLGAAPSLGTNVFSNTGTDVGGFTLTIYDTHEASYATWRELYTFNVVPGPIHLIVETSYDPIANVLSLISGNEPSDIALNLLHSNSLDDQWATLSPTDYTVTTDATTGTVTRAISFDPETKPMGFYCLTSETLETSEASGNTN